MTRHPNPVRPRRRTALAAAAVGLALVTTGCGATDALVGLHPAPAEQPASAPLDEDGAVAIATRLLAAAAADAATKGDEGHDARAKVLAGDALTVADSTAARGAATTAGSDLAKQPAPTVLAQSRGREWPRAILATTLDETTSTQSLHVMVARKPADPYRIEASVPMLAGSRLPSLGSTDGGAPFVDVEDGEGLVMSPAKAFDAYASALARPAPKKAPADVTTDDPFGQALGSTAAVQAKALGSLAKLEQEHEPDLDDAVAFRLADGSAVAFGLMRRTDTITVGAKAKELVLPSRYSRLVGKKKVTRDVRLTSLEPVVLVVPTEGEVSAIGATELLVSGKGR
ncbi:hypothetical protein KMZ32_00660 [Phycicoccus sp. MAQZ13P-2]|uniref:hypothetical protein n=1 Tax=Phycicoccus mangrovi TaxID=2840470 RepID=UPI001C005CD8|nr:hypothetical protein [Phycicoccus mangrovi]MBT9254201.1 hypothetical protein [Phycicoccus mangrovi]MBT9272579.1 hypothetical protein [Phycicoccus mangrovi]